MSPTAYRRIAGALLGCCLLGASGAGRAALAVQDDTGRTLQLAQPARRIVSLAPGATAMLFAAGAGARIVGTARYSDEPAEARRIARVADSGGFDLERIIALRPDVVVVWSGGMGAAQIARLEQAGLKVYRHQVLRLADLPDSLMRLGALAGSDAVASARAADMRQALARLERRSAAPLSVLLQVWDRPLYVVGGRQLMSDVIERCGYRNAFAELAQPAAAVGIESALARRPDYVVAIAPSAAAAAEWLARWQRFANAGALPARRLIAVSDQRFSRLGPSLLDAAQELCARLDAAR